MSAVGRNGSVAIALILGFICGQSFERSGINVTAYAHDIDSLNEAAQLQLVRSFQSVPSPPNAKAGGFR